MAYKNKLSAFKQSESFGEEEQEVTQDSAGDILNRNKTEQEQKDKEREDYEKKAEEDNTFGSTLHDPINFGLSKGNYLYGSEAALTQAQNDGMTELYNTLAVIAEKERENKDARRAEKDGTTQENQEEDKEESPESKMRGYDSDSDGVPDSIDKDTKPGKKKKPNDRDGDGIPDSIDKDSEKKENEGFRIDIPGTSANKMKLSPFKAGVHRFNVDALRKGAMGASNNSRTTKAHTEGVSNLYDVFSIQRDLQRKRTEKELANYNIDEVQSGFESFNNGGSTAGDYAKTKKQELAKLKAKARRVNPNSKKFQDYKSQMKEIDNSMKKLNGVMEGLQLNKADFANKHGKGDTDVDGRFRYSEATRQSDSYFYLQQAMNKTAPMIIQEDGSVVFKVMNKGGDGYSAMTMDQMQEGVYEKDDAGYGFYAAVQDSVAANHKANNYFDETTANANMGKIFGFGEDVNKNNLMSWIHDFPEIGKDGKTFINNYMESKIGDAKIKWAEKTLNLYKDTIGEAEYKSIMKGGVTLEEAEELQKSSFLDGGNGIGDAAIVEEYIPEAKYFDPDNTSDWGQKSTFNMTLSGDGENRTIGMHVRDELKTYYMQMLKDKHNKLVNAEVRGNGKNTYTDGYDPLNPNN